MKLVWHKLIHWEYWPVYVIYTPTFFLWIWWMIRFRSITFYKNVNPAIKNGGLYGDCKIDIYALLPPQYYPKTILINHLQWKTIINCIKTHQFQYPLIVKPNVGLRGILVKKITNDDELLEYAKNINQDFLVQERILYPNEIGLFYHRFPAQKNGKITGITLKKFLAVTGNGTDRIETLLEKNPRFQIQIPTLKKEICIDEILAVNEFRCLVPFGNHSRGTEFLDGKIFITKKLEQTINNILDKIEGFYYGRLDIRYNTFEELEQGENFSIIEINGAKSEPTHIYDPKHTFWFGQKEIYRHQKILKTIVKNNLQSNTILNTNSK